MSRYEHSDAERRIRAAIGQMPYGSMQRIQNAAARVGFDGRHGSSRPIELDALADYLEELGAVLKDVAREHELKHHELANMRGDLTAVRRVFGDHDYRREAEGSAK